MQRYFAKYREDDKFILNDSDYHHIKNVMRMALDSKIEVVYNNCLFLCKISGEKEITIIKKEEENNELDVEIIIAQSLVTENKWDLIIQKLTELGVKKIIPIKTNRSISKIDDRKLVSKLKRWEIICKEASEQSKRTSIPSITRPMSIKELINEEKDSSLKLVCSVNSDNLLKKVFTNKNNYDKIVVVIGPEGGFTKEEESELIDNGFLQVSLGSRVLRTETAAIYMASIINYIFMR